MLLSVVVPVYKVEKYIHECVESILAQTFTDYELILVDDESPDNCPQICDDYAKKYPFIKVVHKSNGGLSSARNAGIKVASGEYIAFVDSDDLIDKNMFSVMLEKMQKEEADICCTGMIQFNDNSTWHSLPAPKEDVLLSGNDIYKFIFSKNGCGDYMPNKIFRRSIFDTVSLIENVIYEDIYIMHEIFSKAKKVLFIKENFYLYRINNQGISHNKQINPRFMDFYYSCLSQYEFAKTISSEIEERAFSKFMNANLWVARAINNYNLYKIHIQDFRLIKKTIKENKQKIKANPHLSKRTKWLLLKIAKGRCSFNNANKRINFYDKFNRRPKIQKILSFIAPQVNGDNTKY